MTTFEKKAIRFCCGYNKDLRVDLNGFVDNVGDFIDEHFTNIFGIDKFYELCPDGVKTDKYNSFVHGEAWKVCYNE